MSEVKYWGAFDPETEMEPVPDVTKDIEFAMNFNNIFLNESDDEDCPSQVEKIIVPPLDPMVLQAIALHRYANNSIDILKLNTHIEDINEIKLPVIDETNISHTNLNFHPQDFSNFAEEDDLNLCHLSRPVVPKILVKSIATLFAQIGYESCDSSALDVLVDVLQEFLKKISNKVKSAMNEEMHHPSGFSHIIEQVLTELGLGGVHALNDYYQSRVVKYVNVLEERCKNLNKEYQSLDEQSVSPIGKINQLVRVKVEEDDVVEVENPEVHFSSIEGDVSFSILEPGYQLLNSLEAETNLQSIGESVDSVDSVPQDEASHLSPFNKRKRFK